MLTVRWMYEWVITALTHDQPSLFAICVCEQLDSFRQRRAFCFAQTSDQWTSRIQRPDSFRSTSIRFDKAFCFALKHPTSGPPVSTPVLDFRRQPTLDSRLCYSVRPRTFSSSSPIQTLTVLRCIYTERTCLCCGRLQFSLL